MRAPVTMLRQFCTHAGRGVLHNPLFLARSVRSRGGGLQLPPSVFWCSDFLQIQSFGADANSCLDRGEWRAITNGRANKEAAAAARRVTIHGEAPKSGQKKEFCYMHRLTAGGALNHQLDREKGEKHVELMQRAGSFPLARQRRDWRKNETTNPALRNPSTVLEQDYF